MIPTGIKPRKASSGILALVPLGMKVHAGADVNSNIAHSVTTSTPSTADIQELPKLLR